MSEAQTSGSGGSESGASDGGGSSEAIAEGQSQTEAGASPGAPTTQAQAAVEKIIRKLKVNGKEVEVPIEELEKSYGLDRAAQEKFKAAKEERLAAQRDRAEIQQLMQRLRDDPFGTVAELDPEAYQRSVQKELDYYKQLQGMDPKDRDIVAMQHKLQKLEAEKTELTQRQQEQQLQQMTQSYHEYYQRAFPEALQQAGVEVSDRTFRQMARIASDASSAGVEWTPESIAEIVADEERKLSEGYRNSRKQKLSSAQAEEVYKAFVEEYGDEVLNKFREHDVKRVREPQTQERTQPHNGAPAKKSGTPQFKSLEQLREAIERRNGG